MLGGTNMLAYLSMMAPRLVELRRVLKSTGSIYLHCDPTPGLDGTLSGTCVACYTPTDTALAVLGIPEWHGAFLFNIGAPQAEAFALVEKYGKAQPDQRRYEAIYQVCGACAAKMPNFPRPALVMLDEPIPVIEQPAS
jgi:hypothetical protein